ncbi:hypothetical protein [[Kitasatospora] papulosa]|uniref:hypothetical protein n=1 Tax=[Kitasatospora] papulosa TaxID=1464011 RepID=UPI0036C7E3FA
MTSPWRLVSPTTTLQAHRAHHSDGDEPGYADLQVLIRDVSHTRPKKDEFG